MTDNSINKELITKISSMSILSKRLLAFLIDLLFFGFLSGLISFIFDKISSLNILNDYVIYIVILIFICRDLFSVKGSVGKKMLNLQIMNKNRSTKSNFIKRFLRNLTTIIWPIELIVLVILKERISDKFLGLEVIEEGSGSN